MIRQQKAAMDVGGSSLTGEHWLIGTTTAATATYHNGNSAIEPQRFASPIPPMEKRSIARAGRRYDDAASERIRATSS